MDGIHYLQRAVGILVFQSVVDKLHVGLARVGQVRSGSKQVDSDCTISLMRETKPNQGVKCKGGITNPRRSVVPVLILSHGEPVRNELHVRNAPVSGSANELR